MSFPLTFPFPLPGSPGAYAPVLDPITGTALAWLGDYCGEGTSLLLAQFRRPLIEALVCALSSGPQDVENATWQVLTERWLDDGLGVQLDRIGELLGLPRAGWDDDTYRALLRAQVLVLRSSGTWPDLFGVLAVVGVDLALVTHAEHYPAAILIVLGEPLADLTGADLFGLLERARAAAIRLVLELPTVDVTEAFTWADADVDQADTLRGWADDTSTLGGYWTDSFATRERV